jgi:nucleoside-diphosphate-sugar epimerase
VLGVTRVAVTGASGFVGQCVCAALRAQGHEVRAVVRRAGSAPAGTLVAEVPGLEATALAGAFAGCHAVVHLAARVHVMRETAADPLAEFRRVNVLGAETAYRAACATGVRRFVLLSSVKVHGEGRATPYVEGDPPAPADPYGVSKLEAERGLTAARAAGGAADLVVLRAPLVYGPGVGGNFRRLIRLAELAQRWPLPLGGLGNRRSLVAVQNLADAIRFVLQSRPAGDRTFLVSDGEDVSTSDLIARLARALGGRARLLPCPAGAVRLLAALAGRRAITDRLLGTLTVDSAALRTGLGWTPPYSVDATLAEVARWWAEGRGA